MLEAMLSLMMLAAVVLLGGTVYLWRARSERQRPLLMLLLALIMLVNVGIWTLPDASGEAPAERTVQ